jgi:hypothetical protein
LAVPSVADWGCGAGSGWGGGGYLCAGEWGEFAEGACDDGVCPGGGWAGLVSGVVFVRVAGKGGMQALRCGGKSAAFGRDDRFWLGWEVGCGLGCPGENPRPRVRTWGTRLSQSAHCVPLIPPTRYIWPELGSLGEVYVKRRGIFQLLAGAAICVGNALFASPSNGKDQASQNHVAWVTEVLMRMQTIMPGMTREALYRVFTTEGGLSTGLQCTFVSRDCPYFKVDVDFQGVGRPDRDGNGRVTLVEDGKDLILKISRPYLQFGIKD